MMIRDRDESYLEGKEFEEGALRWAVTFALFVAAIVVLLVATAAPAKAEGRYVFRQLSDMRRDQYMLDTKMGRLWVIVLNPDDKRELQVVPYYDQGNRFAMPPLRLSTSPLQPPPVLAPPVTGGLLGDE